VNTVQPIRNKNDIKAMRKALRGRDRLLFVLGINTSLRISDILKLRISDLYSLSGVGGLVPRAELVLRV
jgi:integrase